MKFQSKYIIPFFFGILLIILFIQYSVLNPVYNIFKKPKMFVINDPCSLIFNQVVHKIKNDGDCKINCKNEIQLKEVIFYKSEFIEKNNSCNTCNCYYK
jgi:hypothetical protein